MGTSDRLLISTWMYADGLGEESVYPAMLGRSSSQAFQAVYWRCIAVFFAVSVRQHPAGARHLLYTNVDRLPDVDGLALGPFLDRLGVEVVRRPYTYAPAGDYYPAWRNQFYVFAALADLAAKAEDDAAVLLLDSDVLFARPASALAPALARHGALTYRLGFYDDHGLTASRLGRLAAELDPALSDAPLPYCGGEIVAATGATLRRMMAEVPGTWRTNADRFAAGLPCFREEAHLLTYLYRKLGVDIGTADPFVRRIWTALFRERPLPSDADLVLWHLPGEKRYGFRRLFRLVARPGSVFWTTPAGAPLRALLGRYVGIPGRTAAKTVQDLVAGVRYKAGL